MPRQRMVPTPAAGARPEVRACYDHLGGVLGERIFVRWQGMRWIQPQGDGSFMIPLYALTGMRALGIETDRMRGSTRNQVAGCTERFGGGRFEHTGGHLGALLRDWVVNSGWVDERDGGLHVTDAGRGRLSALGVLP